MTDRLSKMGESVPESMLALKFTENALPAIEFGEGQPLAILDAEPIAKAEPPKPKGKGKAKAKTKANAKATPKTGARWIRGCRLRTRRTLENILPGVVLVIYAVRFTCGALTSSFSRHALVQLRILFPLTSYRAPWADVEAT